MSTQNNKFDFILIYIAIKEYYSIVGLQKFKIRYEYFMLNLFMYIERNGLFDLVMTKTQFYKYKQYFNSIELEKLEYELNNLKELQQNCTTNASKFQLETIKRIKDFVNDLDLD